MLEPKAQAALNPHNKYIELNKTILRTLQGSSTNPPYIGNIVLIPCNTIATAANYYCTYFPSALTEEITSCQIFLRVFPANFRAKKNPTRVVHAHVCALLSGRLQRGQHGRSAGEKGRQVLPQRMLSTHRVRLKRISLAKFVQVFYAKLSFGLLRVARQYSIKCCLIFVDSIVEPI